LQVLIAPAVQEPAPCSIGEFVLREARSDLEQRQGGERVGCILFAPEHRQVHLGNVRVSQFMEHQGERISRHEFYAVDPLLICEAFETGIVLERYRSGLDPLL